LNSTNIDGDIPFLYIIIIINIILFKESGFFVVKSKECGKYHIKLNKNKIPIVYKYCEGKMKITLREG